MYMLIYIDTSIGRWLVRLHWTRISPHRHHHNGMMCGHWVKRLHIVEIGVVATTRVVVHTVFRIVYDHDILLSLIMVSLIFLCFLLNHCTLMLTWAIPLTGSTMQRGQWKYIYSCTNGVRVDRNRVRMKMKRSKWTTACSPIHWIR